MCSIGRRSVPSHLLSFYLNYLLQCLQFKICNFKLVQENQKVKLTSIFIVQRFLKDRVISINCKKET